MEGPEKVDSSLTPKRGRESVFLGVRGLAGRVLAVTNVTTKSKDSKGKRPAWRNENLAQSGGSIIISV